MNKKSKKSGNISPGSEKSFSFSQTTATLLCGLLFFSYASTSSALPSGGAVVGGEANIGAPQDGKLTINQISPKAIIDWQKFGIGANEAVNFMQTAASAIILNRVTGNESSKIYGELTANGKVFIVNPNGILFGRGSKVDVAGLVATTFDINNDDFMTKESYTFTQNGSGKLAAVVNEGQITITERGGFAYLVAAGVENRNGGEIIVAKAGNVVMASGTETTLDFSGNGLVNFRISGQVAERVLDADGNPLSSSVSNKGNIKAEGGQVILSGETARDVVTSVVNNSGVIEASSFDDLMEGGSVKMEARNGGKVANSGSIKASATKKKAGSVSLKGGDVDQTGTIEVISAEDEGGIVAIEASSEGTVANSGNIKASGKKKGGKVSLKGKNVNQSSTIDASSDEEGGTVAIEGGSEGSVANTGTGNIKVSGKKKAGKVSLKGKDVNQSGTIDASSDGEGGIVEIEGTEGNVVNKGSILASGKKKAGKVSLKGKNVGQFGSIVANSEESDGGSIELAATDAVALGDGSTTTANATGVNGNGGTIKVTGGKIARIGTGVKLQAKGGTVGGNGGSIETTGGAYLSLGSVADVSRTAGNAGSWLIKTADFSINGTAVSGVNEGGAFDTATGTSNLNVDILLAALKSGNVTVTATGSIAVDAEIKYVSTKDSIIDANLTFDAGKNITISNNIISVGTTTQELAPGVLPPTLVDVTSDPAKLNLVFKAGADGVISLAKDKTITTGGGSFITNGEAAFTMAEGSKIDAGTSTITIQNGGSLKLYGLSAGNITVTGADGIDICGILLATNNVSLEAVTGSIITSGSGVIIADSLDLVTKGTENASIGKVTYTVDGGGKKIVKTDALKVKVNKLSASTQSGVNGEISTGNIIIDNSSTGDLTLGKITTNGNKGDNDIASVIITSTGGGIIGSGTGIHIDAFSVSLIAKNDITLNTNMSAFLAETKYSGSITINNTSNNLFLLGVIAREYGNEVTVTSSGDMKAVEKNADGTSVTYHDGTKNVNITTTGNIGIQGNLSATNKLSLESKNGSIMLYSESLANGMGGDQSIPPVLQSNNISLTAAGAVGASGASLRTLTGNRMDIKSGTVSQLVNGTSMDIGGIFIEEMNRLNIGTITAEGSQGNVDLKTVGGSNAYFAHADSKITAKDGIVTITSNSGRLQTVAENTGVVIEAKGAVLNAKSIGTSSKAIQTKLDTLSVTASDAANGQINVNNSSNLSAISVSTPGGSVVITTAGVNLTFSNELLTVTNGTSTSLNFANTTGNIQVNGIDLGTNDLTITAEKSLTQNSGTLKAGAVTLTVGENIGTSASHLKTQATSLNLTSGKNGIYVDNASNGAGGLQLNATASGSSSDIWISHSGVGDMVIKKVISAKGGVKLTSDGSILNGYDTSGTVNIKGNALTLTAGGSIGVAGNAITTNISKADGNADFTATANNGAIVINNSGSINLNASTSGTGDITFTNSGNIGLGTVNAGSKDVTLKANSGSITDANGDATNITAKNLNLLANSIGTSSDKLEISVEKLDVTTTNGALYLKQIGNSDFYLAYATVAGTASVEAGGTIMLGVVDARGQNVILKSENGDILDNRLPGEKNANVRANTLDISGRNLGLDGKGLDLNVAVLNASSSAGGSIFAENMGALQVTADSLKNKGVGQTVSITASTITIFDNNGGTTTLDNNGSLRLIAKNGNIVFLNDKDTIRVTGSGSIYLEALGTVLPAEETGLVGVIVAGNLITDGGDITLKASSHISINLLSTGRASGTVRVESQNGQIIDNNGSDVNIIAKNVVLSGKTSTADQLERDKNIATSDLATRITNLQTQIQLQGYSKANVDAYNTLVALYLEKYGRSQSTVANTESDLASAEATAKALYITFQALTAAFDAANLVTSIIEIPAGAAQAIPLVGDGGTALTLGIVKSVLAGMQLAVNQASIAADKADDKVSGIQTELTEAKGEMYTNKELLDTNTTLLTTNKAEYADLTDKVNNAKIATAASRILEALAYKAADNNNVVGTASQALGVEADNVDVNARGQSNVYLESSTSIGLGNVTAQGKDTVIEVTAKDNITLNGTSTSTKNVVLYSKEGSIIAGTSSKLVTDDLVAVAKNGIGSSTESVKTQVKRIAASTENGGAYFVNSNADEALTIDEISVNTSNLTKTVTGVSAKDDVLIETSKDLVLNKAVRNTSKAGTVTLKATTGSITGVADTAATANHVEGGTLNATAANGIGTADVALRTDIAKLTGEVTGAGLINITEKNGIELTSVKTADGSINVKAGDSIDAKNVVSTTDAEGNTITLEALNGNITAGTITAGKTLGDITLTASEGQVNNDADTTTRITGHALVISAKSGIGAVGTNANISLDTDVASLDATTKAGVINISESDDLDVVNASTGDGNITVANAKGDLNITNIEAKGTGNTVTLEAVGAITDAKNDGTAIISAANLAATAGKGIGSAENAIEVNVDKLEAKTGAGGIYVNDLTGDLQIGGVTPNLGKPALSGLEAGAGDIVITTAGGMNVSEIITATEGDIVLSAEAGDLTTTAAITAAKGDVDLTAGKGIEIDGTVTASNDVVMTAEDGDITTKKAIEATTGDVNMTASADVTTNDTVKAGQNVLVTATAGDILTQAAITAAGKNVELTAGKGITTNGTITANIDVLMDAQGGNILSTKAIKATTGDVDMTASANVTTTDTVNADKNVLITATDGDILAEAAIAAAKNNVELTAGKGITTNGTVTANIDVLMDAQGGNILSTKAINATTGDVDMTASANVTTTGTVNADKNVLITATAGDILAEAAIAAAKNNVELTAGKGITTNGTVTANIDVLMDAQGGNILSTKAINATTGNVDMTASANVTTTDTVNADQKVLITATDGNILAEAAIAAAKDNVELTAGNDITTNGTVSAEKNVLMTAEDGSILAEAAIAAAKNNVELTAGKGITTNGTVTANIDVLMDAQGGNILSTKAINATTGDVDMTASANVTTTDTVNADKNVLITATDGDILAEAAIAAAKNNVELTAGKGITTNGTVTANIDVLMDAQGGNILSTKAINATTGNVDMTASANVTTTDTVNADQKVLITATDGNILAEAAIAAAKDNVELTAGNDITTNGTVSAEKNVLMTAEDGNILTKAAIAAAKGNVDMTAGKGIGIDGTVTANVDVLMDALGGDIATTAAIKAKTGKVDMNASENVLIGRTVVAGRNAMANALVDETVTAGTNVNMTAGKSIVIHGDVTAHDDVVLAANGGDITTTAAVAATTGKVDMDATANVTIGDTVTAAKNVEMTAGKAIAINAGVTAQEDVVMVANDGDITTTAAIAATTGKVDMDASANVTLGKTVTAAKNVELTAGKGIAVNGAVTANNDVLMQAKAGDITTTAKIAATTGKADMSASANVNIGETVTADAGNISMLASTGNINLNQTVSAANGEVTLEATQGIIQGTANKPPVYHVVTKVLKAIAAKGINLRTSINQLVGKLTGKGDVIIDQTGALLADVTTEDGAIKVTASGTIDAVNIVSKTDSEDNDITLTSKDANILVGKIEAGQGKKADVILTAENGTVTAKRPTGTPIVADELVVKAKSNIDLDTKVNSADLIVSNDGNIAINETDDLVLKRANAKGKGSISIVAGGQLAAVEVVARNGSVNLVAKDDVIATRVESTTNAVGNDINITSREHDIIVDSVVAGTGTGGNVTLKAEAGSIRENDPKDNGVDIVGNTISLHAKGDIGGLDVNAEKLNAYSSQGNISLAEANNVIIQELHAKNGTIKVTAGGSISDDNNNATRIIARNLVLEAVSGIGLTGDASTRALDTEVASLTASVSGLGGINIDQKGNIEIKRVTSVDGDITITAEGAVGLDFIAANGTGNTVTLKSIGGAITDINDTDTEKKLNIVADRLNIEASKGVGTRNNVIEVSVSQVSGNGGTGGLYIDHNRDKVVIDDFITEDGDIVLTTPGELVINSPIRNLGGGDIYITITDTGRDDDNLVLNAEISATGNGSIYLKADDYIYQNANMSVENRGNIEVVAGKSIYMATGMSRRARAAFYMANSATTTADLGNIVYRANDEIVLGKLITSYTVHGGTVSVTAASVRNNNVSGEAAIQSGYISVTVKNDPTRNRVSSLIGGVDNSYGIWVNNRLVGGLVSRDAEFIGQPHFEDALQDIGYKLFHMNDRNKNILIDSSSYEKKGYVYDEASGTWGFVR